ncbi:PH domain-containing protein [Amycolatopsis marina]|uniref:PH domain-containing protein n=1 Tax=Amycolatopsis marina TaxID=490629 RepID=A0A1I0YHG2_9PSEU|nr:PH domain-containing protein [Amycolatopsis marina]SFB12592.1 PH domain-containing protein [Amycolatopsis marina]
MNQEAQNSQREAPVEGRKAIFRIPATAMLAVAFLTICVTPAAFALPGLQALYLAPIALAVWVIRMRTTATAEGLTVRTVFNERKLHWSQLRGLAVAKGAKVKAVTTEGTEVALPAVRARHLPVLSLISGGRVPDPTGITEEITEEDLRGGPKETGSDEE